MAYILASASPRRRELMPMLGITEFEIVPAVLPEPEAAGLSPEKAVERIARGKAEEVAGKYPEDVVIAADTLVYSDGAALGKPKDAADAARMLRALSGRSHEVWSGAAVAVRGRLLTAAECTRVEFRPLSEEEIAAYIATGEPMDKAGAYGIQGRASVMIRGICGDYYNVVGFPLCRIHEMLRELGALPEKEGTE